MKRFYDAKSETDRVLLGPGEHFATCEPLTVNTVLGSCISVCLWDPVLRCGGMNHFMLPAPLESSAVFYSDAGRYGMNAMELLINEMLNLGVDRTRLVGKVFGGAHVLDTGKTRSALPDSNAAFALEYLAAEQIRVIAKDVGGNVGRQLRFATSTGAAYVRKLSPSFGQELARRESNRESTVPSGIRSVEIFDAPLSRRRER